jgi:hypothetical protein
MMFEFTVRVNKKKSCKNWTLLLLEGSLLETLHQALKKNKNHL